MVYIYLMDSVYGTIFVYQLEEGDPINGYTIDSIDTTYENTFGDAAYDFDEALGINFYQSTDKIGEDWSVISSTDDTHDECADPLFSEILAHTCCTSGPMTIGYFECSIYADAEDADTYYTTETGLDDIFGSSNISFEGTDYTVYVDGEALEDDTTLVAGNTYTITFVPATGYWLDENNNVIAGNLEYTIVVLSDDPIDAIAPDTTTGSVYEDANGDYYTTDGTNLEGIFGSLDYSGTNYTVYVDGEALEDDIELVAGNTYTIGLTRSARRLRPHDRIRLHPLHVLHGRVRG